MNERFTFRKALMADADRIWQIILQAKEQMRRLGSRQWQDDYPMPGDIARDIEQDHGYVLCDGERVIAYGAIIFDGESAYAGITEGAWHGDEPYVVVHRLAVADEAKQRGIATRFMQETEELSRQRGVYNFRVDTNFDNHYMHKMLARLGFEYRGKIKYDRGERLAYEKRVG